MASCSLEEATFYFLAGVVFVVQYAELRVAAFAVQVEPAFGVRCPVFGVGNTVKLDAVLHQLAYAVGRFADCHFHHLAVADAVAGHQGVVDVLVEGVAVVHHGGDTALSIASAAFIGGALGQDAHLAVGSHLQGETQAGDARPDDKKVYFVSHSSYVVVMSSVVTPPGCPGSRSSSPRGRRRGYRRSRPPQSSSWPRSRRRRRPCSGRRAGCRRRRPGS